MKNTSDSIVVSIATLRGIVILKSKFFPSFDAFLLVEMLLEHRDCAMPLKKQIGTVSVLPLQLDCDEDSSIRGDEDEPDFYVQAHMPV